MRSALLVRRPLQLLACAIVGLSACAAPAVAGPVDLDPAFDGDGVATTPLTGIVAVARDGAGRTVLAGTEGLIRLTAGGAIDSTFAGGAPRALGITPTSLAIGPDDSIYVGGSTGGGASPLAPAVEHVTPTGAADSGFGASGVVTIAYTDGASPPAPGLTTDLVVSGNSLLVSGRSIAPSTPAFVARLSRSDGAGDLGFGTRGVTLTTGVLVLDTIIADSNGRAVAAGCSGGGGNTYSVLRFTSSGAPDPSFGSAGIASPTSSSSGTACATQLAARGTGVVVAGSARSGDRAELLALTATGAVDAGFQRRLVSWPGSTVRNPAIALDRTGAGSITLVSGLDHGAAKAAGILRVRDDGTDDASLLPAQDPGSIAVVDVGLSSVVAADARGRVPVTLGGGSRAARVGTANRTPVVGSLQAPATAYAGETVQLSASATDPDTGDGVASYAWDFGDGAAGTGDATTHRFTQPGTYTVSVRATDRNGEEGAPRTATITVAAPPETTASGTIEAQSSGLISDVPFAFSLKDLSITPELSGPATVQWDFGDRYAAPWRESELLDPASRDSWNLDATGVTATHTFPTVFAPNPAVKGSPTTEVRRSYVVRARILDRFGRVVRVIGRLITVQPDRAPLEGIQWIGDQPGAPAGPAGDSARSANPSYNRTTWVWAPNADPDGALDRIARETWDFDGDGTADLQRDLPPCTFNGQLKNGAVAARQYAECMRANAVSFNLQQLRLAGRPPMSETLGFFDFLLPAEDLATKIANRAAELNLSGLAATAKPRTIRLTQTDLAGRSTTTNAEVRFAKWRTPVPQFTFPDGKPEEPGTAPAAGQKGVTLRTPILADADPNKRDGTTVRILLNDTSVDPATKVAYHVLRIGRPSPPPCANPKTKQNCKPGSPSNLQPGSVVRTFVRAGNGPIDITFPAASGATPWSIQDTVYDDTGATGVARYDGFVVRPPGEKSCASIDGEPIGSVAVSADCVTSFDQQKILTTPFPATINGVKVQASAGKVLMFAVCPGVTFIVAIAPGSVKQSCDAIGKKVPSTSLGDLRILIDDNVVSEIPGTEADAFAQLITKLGTRTLDTKAGARYKGLEINGQDPFTLTLSKGGASTIGLTTILPGEFGAPKADPSTGDTTINARVVPREVVINRFDGLGQFAAGSRKPLLKARRAGGPAACGGPSSIAMPPSLTVAGFNLSELGTLCYDPATDTFEASTELTLLDRAVKAHLILRDGHLELIEGSVDADIPVGGGITVKRFAFKITDAAGVFVLQASADFSDATGAITGRGTITITPSKPEFRIDADIQISVIPAHATFVVNPDGVALTATAARDFGPVGFTANVNGAFGPAGFFVEGTGRACLGACLTVKALLSHQAAAGCGELDLLFTSIAAGFGYRYKSGSTSVWMGSCDLSSYRPAGLASTATLQAVRAAAAPKVPSAGGGGAGSLPIPPLPAPGANGWEIPTRPSVAAISVVTRAAVAGPVPTPGVELLYVKDGVATSLARTTDELGAVNRTPGGVLVDQDPVSGEVRFLVPSPQETGVYAVRALPGSQIFQPQYAYGSPPVTKAIFSKLELKTLTPAQGKKVASGGGVVVGAGPTGATPIPATGKIAGKKALTLATAARAGVKPGTVAKGGVVTPGQFEQKNPDAIPAKSVLVAENAVNTDQLTTWEAGKLKGMAVTGKLPPGEQVHFLLRSAAGTNLMAAVVSDEKGEFAAELTFPGYAINDDSTRCVDAMVTTPDQVPRGTVKSLVCFKVSQLPDPAKTKGAEGVEIDPALTSIKAKFGEPRVLGDTPMGVLSYAKGRIRGSVVVTPNLIASMQTGAGGAGLRGSAAARRLAATRAFNRRPVRSRTWQLKIKLPRAARGGRGAVGDGSVRVQVLGAQRPGAKGKVVRSKVVTLTRKKRSGRF